MIPVVLGGGNYDYYIPKSSFINVLDYKNARQLADYLIYQSENQTESYNSYFKWKKYAKFNGHRQLTFNPICDMCIRLNLEEFYPNNLESKIIYDIGNYWNKSLHCKVPDLGLSQNKDLNKFLLYILILIYFQISFKIKLNVFNIFFYAIFSQFLFFISENQSTRRAAHYSQLFSYR